MQNNEIWDGEEFSSLVVIPPELDGTRADAALAKLTDQSRSAIERLMEGGQIFRGEVPEKAGKLTKKDKVKVGEVFTVLIPPPEDYDVQPEEMALDIVYEDGDTPMYYWGFTGQLKCAIDRLFAVTESDPAWKTPEKDCVMLMAAEGNSADNNAPVLDYYHSLLKFLNWKDLGTVIAGGVLKTGDIKGHSALAEAKALGESIR